MSKKIKFPLQLLNGVQVRTIEQLRDNFDFGKILNYFVEGKLQIWLQDRYYENEAERIKELNKNEDFNILKTKICEILGVEYQGSDEFDIDQIEKRNKRINMLCQYTYNEDVIKRIDNVVFDQEELANILDMGIDTIYLFKGRYTIPLNKMNMTYIGIDNPIITVDSKEDIDFDSKYIILKNVTIMSEKLITIKANSSSKIKYDGNLKLNHDKDWIVYLKKRQFYDATLSYCIIDRNGEKYQEVNNLYRSRPDGSCEELLVKEDDDICLFYVFENDIFYALHEAGNVSIYKVDINGNNKENLNIKFHRNISSLCREDERILFCNKKWIVFKDTTSVYKVKHNGDCTEKIVNFLCGTDIEFNNNYLFYIDSNRNWSLYRFDLDTNETIIIDSGVKKIEKSMEKLYYVKRNESHYCFYETNLEGKDKRLLERVYTSYPITRLEWQDGILYYYQIQQAGCAALIIGGPEIKNKIVL